MSDMVDMAKKEKQIYPRPGKEMLRIIKKAEKEQRDEDDTKNQKQQKERET